MDCVDLYLTLSDRYRISWDPVYDPAHVPHNKRDPWMMQLRGDGPGVTIYPFGRTTLAVEVDRRPSITAKLMVMEGIRLHQDGDTEKTFLFEVSLFEQVAQVVKPRKRRQVTPSQLAALLKHQRRYEVGAQKSTLK